MTLEKLEKQYNDFLNNLDLPKGKKYVIQYSYINKIIEFAQKENNLEKVEEYKYKKQAVAEELWKIGIKITE